MLRKYIDELEKKLKAFVNEATIKLNSYKEVCRIIDDLADEIGDEIGVRPLSDSYRNKGSEIEYYEKTFVYKPKNITPAFYVKFFVELNTPGITGGYHHLEDINDICEFVQQEDDYPMCVQNIGFSLAFAELDPLLPFDNFRGCAKFTIAPIYDIINDEFNGAQYFIDDEDGSVEFIHLVWDALDDDDIEDYRHDYGDEAATWFKNCLKSVVEMFDKLFGRNWRECDENILEFYGDRYTVVLTDEELGEEIEFVKKMFEQVNGAFPFNE